MPRLRPFQLGLRLLCSMHRVFVTPGFVLSKRGVGESNTLVSILTRELGLLRASARSARKEASKLRFGLEPLTTARFSLVRGRQEWKLIGVEAMARTALASTSSRRGQEGRISRLILRLIPGEEPIPELFDTVVEGLHDLSHILDVKDAEAAETILVLRIVEHLGYMSVSEALSVFLQQPISSPELLRKAIELRPLLIRTINESLMATGL